MSHKHNNSKLYLIPNVLVENTIQATIPEQVKEVVSQLDYFLVENIKTARRYISALNIGKIIDDIHFEIIDKRTTEDDLMKSMEPIFFGKEMGIISEAGCPGIADPGSLAVRIAHENSIPVIPLTGPSSIFLGLMASGLNGQSFSFHGYLPIQKNERIKQIKLLEKSAIKTQQTQIFIETPYRNNQLLDDILKHCHPLTQLCIASNLTAAKEKIITKPIEYWQHHKPNLHKLPVVFLLNV